MRIPALLTAAIGVALVATLWFWPDDSDDVEPVVGPDPAADAAGPGDQVAATDAGVPRRDVSADSPALHPVVGRVVGADGAPLAAAEVVLQRLLAPWPAEQVEELDRALSGRGGKFQFGVVADGDLVVTVRSAGHARARVPAPAEVEFLEVRLEPGFTVRGVVVGPKLRPAPGASVALEPGPWSHRRALSTTTDEAGRFQFDDVPAGETGVARITARLDPFQPATVSSHPIGSDESLRIQILMQPGLPIFGKVTRAGSGAPVPDATVRAYPSIAWNHRLCAPTEATTDASGSYRLPGQSLGAALVTVEHPELSAASRVVTVGKGTEQQSFELVRRSTVEAKVIGEDVEGVELVLTSVAHEMARATVDADGVARFDGALSAGPATLELVGGARAFARSSGRILSATVEDAEETLLDLELVAPSRLRGRVVDADGAPVGGVTVSTPRFRYRPRHPGRWFAQTDAEGRFEMLGLPVGAADLTFRHPDFAPVEVDVETPVPGEESSIADVRVVRPGAVRGQVSRGGEPLAGAVLLAGRERGAGVSAVSDAEGRYELRLAPGRYRILARYASMPIQVSDGIVTVEGGAAVEGVDLDFPHGRRVQGVVSGAGAIPVPDALVFVAGVTGGLSTTDQNGRFELDVPEGEFELQVFSPDFQIQVRERFASRSDMVHIRLPRIAHGVLSGMFLGAGPRGLRRLGEAILRVRPLDPRPEWDENERRQRELSSVVVPLTGGQLSFDRMPVGESRVEITAPGYVPFTAEVRIERNTTLDLGTVRLEPGLELQGIVRDVDGRPIAGAFAHLGLEGDLRYGIARRAMTDAEGLFTVRGVAPDARRLVVYADGYTSRMVEVRIPEDLIGSEPLPVVLQRASTVVVQLVRDGAPSTELRLVSVLIEGRIHQVRGTSAEGRLTFDVDRPGRYTVALFGEEEEDGASVEFEIGDEPERRVIELELK